MKIYLEEDIMEKRKWQKNNVETSLLGFGAMRLKTIDGQIDEEKGFALFDKAYYSGVNYFDTARVYTSGLNEGFVGKALKRYPRESFYLATKCSFMAIQTKEEFEGIIDKQLESLQVDYIDFYLMHALNKDRLKQIKEWDMMKTIVKWKEEGKIRHIGFSFHDDYDTFIEILDYFDWEFCQIQLNYVDQHLQQGIKGYYELEKRGIPAVIMEPVKGGKLAKFCDDVEKVFKDYDEEASIASWALRWVGSLPGVKVILSGMNEMEQVEDNLKTFENFKSLTVEEYEIIERAIETLKSREKVGCTKCEYCMPCPKGVNIPRNFSIYNDYAMYNDKNSLNWSIGELEKAGKGPSACVACGLCVKKCPQGINIPQVLKELKAEIEKKK